MSILLRPNAAKTCRPPRLTVFPPILQSGRDPARRRDKSRQCSSQSRHAACSMSTQAASQLIWGPGALLERTCLARRLAGSGAECGLPPAELLSAVSLVVAGRDQGGGSRLPPHPRDPLTAA